MRKRLLSAGLLAAFTFAVHLVGGGRNALAPALAAAFAEVPKRTLQACWHLVSADLALGAAILLAAGLRPGGPRWDGAVAAVSLHFLAYGAVFIVLALGLPWSRPLLQLPQWTLLLPVGVLGLWGLAPRPAAA